MLVLEKEKYEEYLEYDQEKQQIKFVEDKGRMEELEPFRTEDNIFDIQKYFFTFMELIFTVICTLDRNLLSKLNLSMDPLTTNFTPCKTCMGREFFKPYAKRCHHKPGCPLTPDNKHREDCGCKNYTSPSLTYSKIGLALHIQFSKWGINLDVDINPPNIPTWNTKHFDGSSFWKLKYLETMLPVGCADERDKTVDMTRASSLPECKRSNRFLSNCAPITSLLFSPKF